MFSAVMNLFFGCRHRTISRPITPVHKSTPGPVATYVACLNCGQQFHYDITTMRMGKAIPRAPLSHAGDFQSSF